MPLSAGSKARWLGVAALSILLVGGWSCKPAAKTAYTVPVESHRLPNGLKVVL